MRDEILDLLDRMEDAGPFESERLTERIAKLVRESPADARRFRALHGYVSRHYLTFGDMSLDDLRNWCDEMLEPFGDRLEAALPNLDGAVEGDADALDATAEELDRPQSSVGDRKTIAVTGVGATGGFAGFIDGDPPKEQILEDLRVARIRIDTARQGIEDQLAGQRLRESGNRDEMGSALLAAQRELDTAKGPEASILALRILWRISWWHYGSGSLAGQTIRESAEDAFLARADGSLRWSQAVAEFNAWSGGDWWKS